MKILHVLSEFKTVLYFISFKRHHTILLINCATVKITFLASVWPAILCNKTNTYVQLGTQTRLRHMNSVIFMVHYYNNCSLKPNVMYMYESLTIVFIQTGVSTYSFLTVDEASGVVTVSEEIDREMFTSIDNVFYVNFLVQSALVVCSLTIWCVTYSRF